MQSRYDLFDPTIVFDIEFPGSLILARPVGDLGQDMGKEGSGEFWRGTTGKIWQAVGERGSRRFDRLWMREIP